MGIHTSIYRIRSLHRNEDKARYSITLTKSRKPLALTNPCEIREEFYFGKSVFQIDNWLYNRIKQKYQEYNETPELYYCELFDEMIYLDDIKALAKDITQVLENRQLAPKILPYPEDLIQEGCAKYDDSYFADLKYALSLLQQIIQESDDDLIESYYIVDIG